MGLLDKIKLIIGYERKSNTYDSSKIEEGDMKMLSNNEAIKNINGGIIYFKKNSKGEWKQKKLLHFKPR